MVWNTLRFFTVTFFPYGGTWIFYPRLSAGKHIASEAM